MRFYTFIMVFFVSISLSASGTQGQFVDLVSPPRKPRGPAVIKPSPGTELTYLTNFHKKIIEALNHEDFNTFGDLLSNYFILLPYDLIIKEERFYLSLFFLIFRLISGVDPCFYESNKKLVSMVKTADGNVYALEFSFAHYAHSPAYMLSGSTIKEIPTIKVICDLEEPDAIKIVGVKKVGAQHYLFFEEDEVPVLRYEQNNFARNVLSILAEDEFDLREFKANLLRLYNTIPASFIIEKEKYFQAMFVLLLTFVRAGASLHEIVSNVGRSDVMVSSEAVINVIEFKHKGSVAKALKQIKDRRYCSIYHLQKKSIRMVGINVRYLLEDGVHVSVGAEPYGLPQQAPFEWVGDKENFKPSLREGSLVTKKLF